MTVNPAAWLSVAGTRITGTVSATAPVALSALEVTWGRRDLFTQPDPATAVVTLFDPTGVWGTRLDSRGETDQMGEVALIGWTDAAVDHTLFRGRVTSIEVETGRLGGMDGAYVHLGMVSSLVELGASYGLTAWPNERQGDRFTRLIASVSSRTAGNVTTGDNPAPISGRFMRARGIREKSYLQGLYDIYTASGQFMTYLPDITTLRGVTRRVYPGVRGLVGLSRGGPRVGAYLTTRAQQVYNKPAGQLTTPLYLEAHGTPRARRGRDQRSTSFTENGWTYTGTLSADGTPAAGYTATATTVTIARGSAATTEMTIDTEVSVQSGTSSTPTAANELSAIAAAEGAAPVLDPIVLDLERVGGLPDLAHALELLAGGEQPSPVFVPGTAFPRLGIRPVFGIIGGTIAHTGGRWLLTLQPAPVATDTKQHAITWAEIDDGTVGNRLKIYTDGLEHADALHESVTCEDLLYCSMGLGVTTPGPDTGWDKLQ